MTGPLAKWLVGILLTVIGALVVTTATLASGRVDAIEKMAMEAKSAAEGKAQAMDAVSAAVSALREALVSSQAEVERGRKEDLERMRIELRGEIIERFNALRDDIKDLRHAVGRRRR